METSVFFERILCTSDPYSITNIDQDQAEENGIHIYVEVSSSYRPTNSNSIVGTKHDVEIRKWRHLDLFQYPCYIHCEVPKFKYGKGADSYVETLSVPWSRPNSGFTLLFEELIMNFVSLHGCVRVCFNF
ncbi:MAG: transposase family protein [Bacteroidota bacterium]